MNITPNMIFFVVSLLLISAMTVYTLGESLKKLRLRILQMQLEIEKCRKTFERQERHKRKMYYEQKEYLKIPINQKKQHEHL